MGLKINFNNPRILQGHLEQALPQTSLQESTKRFVVGSSGGLAYKLFENIYHGLPLQFRISSVSEMAAVQDYFNAVHGYVRDAGEHAGRHGFKLVLFDEKEVSDYGLDDFIYSTGLGSTDIESAERFQAFLEMIKSGKSKLDKQYEGIVEKAKTFQKL